MMGDVHDFSTVPLQCFLAVMQIAALLDEGITAQRRGKASRAIGRQHMIASAEIIADALTSIVAQKDASGISDKRQPAAGILHHELQMKTLN